MTIMSPVSSGSSGSCRNTSFAAVSQRLPVGCHLPLDLLDEPGVLGRSRWANRFCGRSQSSIGTNSPARR